MTIVACAIDDEDVRQRLAQLLSPERDGISCIEARRDPWHLCRLMRSQQIDVVIFCSSTLDQYLEMQRAIENCRSPLHPVRLIVLSENLTSPSVYRALSFGVDDVLDARADVVAIRRDLLASICRHEQTCTKYLVPGVDIQQLMTTSEIVYADDVDRQIVPMIAAGYTDREISEVVHHSHQVVRNRISRMLFNSGLRNRAQLATRYTLERLKNDPEP